jgi:alanine racemase
LRRVDTPDLAAGGRLTIDLAALVSNYRLLAGRAGAAQAGAVVKADAYGLGAAVVTQVLESAGCRDFFVAHLVEALALKPAMASRSKVYVLNGLQPGAEAACAASGVIPVLNSLEQARRWRQVAASLGRPLSAALQVDSGMARLGLSPSEVAEIAADPPFFADVPLDLVMSHLACADEPGHPGNARQAAAFAALADLLPPARRSLANSAGVVLPAAFQGDVVRLGVSLYGVAPNADRPNPMAPVVRLDARVIQVREIGAGDGVGYGLTYSRDTPGRIATVAVGYADGWPRHLSGVGAAWCRGVRLPIAGRVSMDSMTLDVTALAEHGLALALGDEVELLGPHQTLEEEAIQAGTVPYEILTGHGRRYQRTWLPAPAVRDGLALPRCAGARA